jgi:predicted nucleic acid-binding protein
MMERVFADTDIILDLLAQREPFYPFAAALFSKADEGKLKIFVSALSFANLNYILSKQYTADQARKKLLQFKTLVSVLPVSDKTVDLALSSNFKDFEDGLQYYTAVEHSAPIILTRNIKDYKTANIIVLTAEQFIKSK